MNYSNITRYNKIVLSVLLIALFLCTSFVSSAADLGSVYDQDRISFSEEGQIGQAKMIKVPFSLRGTIRYRRPGSVLLTTILFVMFAVTFLFFDRVQPAKFSWFYAMLFLLAEGVDVRLILPGIPDKKIAYALAKTHYRSLYHHFECATYMYKTSCISEIERDFQDTMAKCREVTSETIGKEKLSLKIVGALAKSMAPLL